MFDLYGMYTLDRITHVPATALGNFDTDASGLTVALDTYVATNTLLSFRYDNMDAGGDLSQRSSQSFIGTQVKQYVRSKIALYARHDHNLRHVEDGQAAARHLREAFFAGRSGDFKGLYDRLVPEHRAVSALMQEELTREGRSAA